MLAVMHLPYTCNMKNRLAHCILTNFPIHINTISVASLFGIAHFVLSGVNRNYDVFLYLKVVLILANKADPDKAAFCCNLSGSSLFTKVYI